MGQSPCKARVSTSTIWRLGTLKEHHRAGGVIRRDKDRDMDRDRGYVDDECVVTWKGGGGPNTLTGNSPSDLPLRRVEEVTRGGRRRLAFVRVLSCFKSNCPQLN